MFKELTNLGLERTSKEAFGFYIIYFLVGVFLGMLAGGVLGFVTGAGFDEGVVAGTIVSVLFCLGVGTVMASQKGSLSEPKFIGLIALSGVLAIFTGGLGGLIPIAYLSTTPNLNDIDAVM